MNQEEFQASVDFASLAKIQWLQWFTRLWQLSPFHPISSDIRTFAWNRFGTCRTFTSSFSAPRQFSYFSTWKWNRSKNSRIFFSSNYGWFIWFSLQFQKNMLFFKHCFKVRCDCLPLTFLHIFINESAIKINLYENMNNLSNFLILTTKMGPARCPQNGMGHFLLRFRSELEYTSKRYPQVWQAYVIWYSLQC